MSLVYTYIKAVASEGTLVKKRELMTLKMYEDVRELFKYMLDPRIVYNIKKIPTECVGAIIDTDSKLLTAVKELYTIDSRGRELKELVHGIAWRCTPELKQVFTWIIARKNPAKVGRSIVNHVWPDLIYKQEYMGAVPGHEKALDRLPWSTGVNVQEKIDGQACLVKYRNCVPRTMHTRQGQDITRYFPVFLGRLAFVPEFDGTVHHELMQRGVTREAGNGLINKQVKNGVTGGGTDEALYSVLLDTYQKDVRQSNRHYRMRPFVTKHSILVQQTTVFCKENARATAKDFILHGGEGVVCKDPDQVFKNGKPWWNVKIKNEFQVELICVGFNEHSVNYDEIGSLKMESSDGLLKVSVGSGLSDVTRSNPMSVYLDEIIEVTAEKVTQDKRTKVYSLSLPRFLTGDDQELPVRTDKDTADTLESILDQEKMSRGL